MQLVALFCTRRMKQGECFPFSICCSRSAMLHLAMWNLSDGDVISACISKDDFMIDSTRWIWHKERFSWKSYRMDCYTGPLSPRLGVFLTGWKALGSDIYVARESTIKIIHIYSSCFFFVILLLYNELPKYFTCLPNYRECLLREFI